MTNAGRFAHSPISDGGTPADVWADTAFPELDLGSCPELVVVAPHPDDETLGFGASAAQLAQRGVRVQVVSVTDGGAAFPGLSISQRDRLEQQRWNELCSAVDVLGLPEPMRLGLPDGELGDCGARLADLLIGVLAARPAGTWCVATWRGDGHPDHEAVGRAAATAVNRTGAILLEYPVWMWHWAKTGDPAVPWDRAQRSPLTQADRDRKKRAIDCYSSQLGADSVLPPFVVDRLLAVGEVVFR